MAEQESQTFSLDRIALDYLAETSVATQKLLNIPEVPNHTFTLKVILSLGSFLVQQAAEGYDEVTLGGKIGVSDREFSVSKFLNDCFSADLIVDLEKLHQN